MPKIGASYTATGNLAPVLVRNGRLIRPFGT